MREILRSFGAISAVMALAALPVADSVNAAEKRLIRASPGANARQTSRDRYNFIASMGGIYRDSGLRRYVARVGSRLAAQANTYGEEFEATRAFKYNILSEPTAGAFVLAKGEVFVTRGLLATANSEDELAAVLAHEIAHVYAGHTVRRDSVGVGGMVEGRRGYNREQELEADRMSIRILADAGYDPFAQARMLQSVAADMVLAMRLGRTSTHSADSEATMRAEIEERVENARIAAVSLPMTANAADRRESHLAAIDGIVYGESPRQGIVHGQTYSDAYWLYSFTLPEGFRFERRTQPLRAVGPEGATVRFDRARTKRWRRVDMANYLVRVAARGKSLHDVVRLTVGGMDAAMGTADIRTKDGQADLRIVAIRFSPRTIYRIQYMMPDEMSPARADELWRTAYSFKRLSRAEAALLEPHRLKVVEVKNGDTVDTLAAQMDFLNHPVLRFTALNGMSANDRLIPGQRVKIVVE